MGRKEGNSQSKKQKVALGRQAAGHQHQTSKKQGRNVMGSLEGDPVNPVLVRQMEHSLGRAVNASDPAQSLRRAEIAIGKGLTDPAAV